MLPALLLAAAAFGESLPPEQAEALVQAVFEDSAVRDWARGASEEEVAAAKLRFMDWAEAHPEGAGQLLSGFLLDERFPDGPFRARFRAYLAEYLALFSDPEHALNKLEGAAQSSKFIAKERGLSDEAYRDLTRQVFEGRGSAAESLAASVPDLPEPLPRPGTALKLDPKAFERARGEGAKRAGKEGDALARDRHEAETLGLSGALGPALGARKGLLARAEEARRRFDSVLASRPEAALTGLKDAELRTLSHSRNELYRWLAAAALARAEHRYRVLLAQLETERAAERMLGGLALDADARAAYARRVEDLRTRLRRLLAGMEEARGVLEADDYEARLEELRGLAERSERAARALEGTVRRVLDPPRLLRRAERREEELGWLERLRRWLHLTFRPEGEEARRILREREARRVLRAELERPPS